MANLFNPPFNPASLSQDQQELLMAALASNRAAQNNAAHPPTREVFDFASGSMESPIFASEQTPNFGGADINSLSDQQFLDYLGQRDSFDFDSVAPGDLIDNDEDSPLGDSPDDEGDLHDKRKSPGDDGMEPNENGAKRREGEEKIAKKPGRKPLTSEPTSKRKAQNRAAQRAFRERKERHLKDLETKVSELEKSSESVNHENGLLRAQVEKLSSELKEYRKRLSLQTSRGSPQSANLPSFASTAIPGLGNNFNFDFAQFGSPSTYTPLFNNRLSQSSISISPSERNSLDLTLTNGMIGRNDSINPSSGSISQGATPAMSDFLKSPHGSISADSPQGGPLNGVTSSNIFTSARENSLSSIKQDSPSYNIFTSPQTTYDGAPSVPTANSEGNTSQSRLFQFKSTSSASSSTSPSSHYNGPSSSCGTSPEPSGQAATSAKDGSLGPINEKDGTIANEHEFCKELGKACGCIANPIPAVMTTTEQESVVDTAMPTAGPVDDNFDFFNINQGKDPFAPISWADYPESNTALLGDGSFTGGFLSDISPSFEMQAPMDWNDLTGSIRTGLTPAIQKPNPMESPEQMLATINEEVVPGENREDFLPCHKIWSTIQQRPDFKDGTLDIDSLCTELRLKAKCSETGVVIDKKDIDAALSRLPAGSNLPSVSS